MYAIRHKRDGRFIYRVNGSDISLSYDKAITFIDHSSALGFMAINHIHKNIYEPIKIMISTLDEDLKF